MSSSIGLEWLVMNGLINIQIVNDSVLYSAKKKKTQYYYESHVTQPQRDANSQSNPA